MNKEFSISPKTVIVLTILILYFFGTSFSQLTTQHTAVVKVCAKEAVPVNTGKRIHYEYRVYTSGEVYTLNNDFGISGVRLNSADVYKKLQVNEVYRVTAYGWRFPFFSRFRNIRSIEKSSEIPIGSC